MSRALASTQFTDEQRSHVREQVQRILASPSFRNSARCSEFLRYVVEKSLGGQTDSLHERCIGIDLFGKPASYDPSEDSLVRVKASEVRRRLGQYYSDADRRDEIRLALPAGSYVPEFVWPEPVVTNGVPEKVLERGSRWVSRLRVPVAVLAVAVLVVAGVGLFRPTATPLEQFWEPVRRSPRPVMLTLGNAPVYVLSKETAARYFRSHPRDGAGPHSIERDPSFALTAGELIPQQGQYVGVGGAQAVLRYTAFLSSFGKRAFLRTGSEYSFSDLRDHPTLMVGAFSSEWTLRAASQMRFRFTAEGNMNYVEDQKTGKRWGLDPYANSQDLTDYVIVARVSPSGSESGELVIIAAGITQYGATTASEFLTQSKYFDQALKDAPADWSRRNMEFVIRAKVVAGTPAPPDVVASHFW